MTNILVTGSTKLDVYRKSGDSMKGRYFLYRIHPLSVAELVSTQVNETAIQLPQKLDDDLFDILYRFGGFPQPFLENDERFYNRWNNLSQHQLFREDLRDLSCVEDIAKIELLSRMVRAQAGQLVNSHGLSKKILISAPTIRKWLKLLSSTYYCFFIQPWHKNISRALVKQPKVFLWDWSVIEDPGARAENFIAGHLLKAVHFWHDYGLGDYERYFIRDEESREVDFLVTKNDEPWFLVEVKLSMNAATNKNLYYFQGKIGAAHAFQVVIDMPFIDKNCFESTEPTIVSAKTFLSQLV